MNAKTTISALAGLLAVATTGLLAAPAQAAPLPTCFGQTVTIMGTPGDDDLYGTAGASDVIFGGGGNDTIFGDGSGDGGSAPDLICGGSGEDYLIGGNGDDKLSGGAGNDIVYGMAGADVMQGGDGNDTVGTYFGFEGTDVSNDVISGGAGDDRVQGDAGADRLNGDDGADVLFDTQCDGPTVLDGGSGDDTIASIQNDAPDAPQPSRFARVVTKAGMCSGGTADRIIGGPGTDTVSVNRIDSVTSVERVARFK